MTKLVWGFTGKSTTTENVVSCVGTGWKPIVLQLIDDLLKLGWDGVVFQCKEKYGGLRFYIGSGTAEMFDLILAAENKSYSVCEVCGAVGKLYHDGWWKTLCPVHAVGREDVNTLP